MDSGWPGRGMDAWGDTTLWWLHNGDKSCAGAWIMSRPKKVKGYGIVFQEEKRITESSDMWMA